ncbi:twin-arginine translocation pathway signal protein [Vibrio amylolyticus]|uniref:Acg family FMN-binding oxidoreductase n=1 Tax=Vibrio amylolyticus TaxID=2847292 RepID=UPI0035504B2D
MDRRKFIKITGLGMGTVALATTVGGVVLSGDNGSFGWEGPNDELKDIRLKVLSYAILSPNPHNKQPWLIRLKNESTLDLFVDPERLLPETDPFHRQIHIGQGTFLESMIIAASGLGHKAQITYFPEGEYNSVDIENKPVARIQLVEDKTAIKDPLFEQLLIRQSNKRPYSGVGLDDSAKQTLSKAFSSNSAYQFSVVDQESHVKELQHILTEAMKVEVGDKARDMETIKMFRFNDDEVQRYRDGFGVEQSGTTGIKKLIAENFFLSRESVEKDPTDFGQQAVTMTKAAVDSAQTFAWFTTPSNSRLDQVLIGHTYGRLNLLTSAMGIAQQPLSQVLQEYQDMIPLQQHFKQVFGIQEHETVQMLVRLGYAEPTKHSPRRSINALVID